MATSTFTQLLLSSVAAGRAEMCDWSGGLGGPNFMEHYTGSFAPFDGVGIPPVMIDRPDLIQDWALGFRSKPSKDRNQ